MKKTVLTFGLLSGGIIILYTIIVFMVYGDFPNITPEEFAVVEILGYLRYVILLLTVIFAIRYFKKQNGNQGTFKQLFMAGFNTVLVVSVLVGLMEFCYMLMNPGFIEQYVDIVQKSMQAKGATAAEIAAKKAEMDNYRWMANPAATGVFYFLETAIIGTILSLIGALIIRTRTNKLSYT